MIGGAIFDGLAAIAAGVKASSRDAGATKVPLGRSPRSSLVGAAPIQVEIEKDWRPLTP